jgi:hypothetical protein
VRLPLEYPVGLGGQFTGIHIVDKSIPPAKFPSRGFIAYFDVKFHVEMNSSHVWLILPIITYFHCYHDINSSQEGPIFTVNF